MHKAGRKTACVRWPVTFNAPIDYRIPEYWNYKDMSDARPYTAAAHPAFIFVEGSAGQCNGLSAKPDDILVRSIMS